MSQQDTRQDARRAALIQGTAASALIGLVVGVMSNTKRVSMAGYAVGAGCLVANTMLAAYHDTLSKR
jgi:hypothetical protein